MDWISLLRCEAKARENERYFHVSEREYTSESKRAKCKQVAQLSQRDRAAGLVSYGQKWKTVNGTQHFTDIIGLSSTTMT